jgi:hypothetical protein
MRTREWHHASPFERRVRGLEDEGRSDNGPPLTNRFDCLTRMIYINLDRNRRQVTQQGRIDRASGPHPIAPVMSHFPSALRVQVPVSRHVTIRLGCHVYDPVRNVSDVVVSPKGDRRMPAHRRCGVARTSVQCSTSVLFRKSSFSTSTRRLNAKMPLVNWARCPHTRTTPTPKAGKARAVGRNGTRAAHAHEGRRDLPPAKATGCQRCHNQVAIAELVAVSLATGLSCRIASRRSIGPHSSDNKHAGWF